MHKKGASPMTIHNRYNLTVATPLSGKELIQLLQQYPEITVQKINKKRKAATYKPLTPLQEKQFMILDQMGMPARNIFTVLGQTNLNICTAQKKAAGYRRKLGLPPRYQGKKAQQYKMERKSIEPFY